MQAFDLILHQLASAPGRNIRPAFLDESARVLNIDPVMFDLVIQWAIKTGLLESGTGHVIRPIPEKRRDDGKGRFARQGRKVLCTYFPDEEQVELEKSDWIDWISSQAGFAKAATENAPQTGKVHFHIYMEFPNQEVGKWLMNIWPEVHIDVVRSPRKAIEYVLKGGNIWDVYGIGLCTGPIETPATVGEKVRHHSSGADKWHEILHAIENDELETIKSKCPHEWICYHSTICKMHAESIVRKMMIENAAGPQSVDLKEKNLFLWGDAGTGKSYIARSRAGPNPYYKLQCKWWDGWDRDNTGIIWNDVVPFAGLNWQTLLDSADEFPFCAETKGGMTAVNPVPIPVTVTSNHSIEELFEHATEARKEAFRRRFTVAEVRWHRFGKARVRRWKIEAGTTWRPPPGIWWDLDPRDGTPLTQEEKDSLREEILECQELLFD
jgi:hypothetical protein